MKKSNVTTGAAAEAEMKRMESENGKQGKLDRLSPKQLKALETMIAAERKRRNPESEPDVSTMSDDEFRKYVTRIFGKKEMKENE